MDNITPRQLYQASVLNALIGRGYAIDSALELAQEAAEKMIEKDYENGELDYIP